MKNKLPDKKEADKRLKTNQPFLKHIRNTLFWMLRTHNFPPHKFTNYQ